MVRMYGFDSRSAPATTVSQLLKYDAPNALSHGRLVHLGFGQVTKIHPLLRHGTQIVQIALVAGYVCSADGCGGAHHRRHRLANRPTRIDQMLLRCIKAWYPRVLTPIEKSTGEFWENHMRCNHPICSSTS